MYKQTDHDRVQFIPIGVYTIMEVQSGKGSSAGWGRLLFFFYLCLMAYPRTTLKIERNLF